MREAATICHAVEFSRPAPALAEGPVVGRVPRVVHQLALAHRVDQMIRSGELEDVAAAAKWAGVTRARMSQITALLLLAPAIQEAILSLPTVTRGRDMISERSLRAITSQPDWTRQLEMWNRLNGTTAE